MPKIVIDISKYDYDWMRNLYTVPDEIRTEIAETIINGTPFNSVIEDIKAEIEHIGNATPLIGTNTVIEIIDKHIIERNKK